ncbi:FAD/FMN-containing protein [Lophiotrema nucula]|uniref:FAD/FMN-containing protein n=1 Tax=Lophiotrema nucula TaxID=690887 RepID=A0A6A5Z5G0_9PLEO|nr:FAD/FMN-containing protein [Lophiotrema nucula]
MSKHTSSSRHYTEDFIWSQNIQSKMRDLVFPLLFILILQGKVAASPTCKCAPHDGCWPSTAVWNDFNATVSGQLIKTEPLAISCYPGPQYNPTTCASVNVQWSNATFQGNSPVGIEYPLQLACPPVNASAGEQPGNCSIGEIPWYAVNATSIEHVSAGIAFGKSHNIRLVIKNTGHDGLGRSEGYGSLEIWIRHLRTGITYRDSYIDGCHSCNTTWNGPAITIGGGYTWADVYPVAKVHGVVVVGGGTPSVGSIGGWMQGGGHGPASRQFGLGADQVLEAQVVLANGSIVTASPCENTDLLSAIRGGGPGTYGVVVSTTVKAWPMFNVTSQQLAITSLTNDSSPLLDALTILYSDLPALNDAGYAGYGSWSIASSYPLFANVTSGYIHSFYMFNRSEQGARAAFATTLQKLLPFNTTSLSISLSYTSYPDYWSFYFTESGIEPPGGGQGTLGSRLFDRASVQDNTTGLREMMAIIAGTSDQMTSNNLELVSGGQVFKDADEPYSGLNPAWRTSYFSNIVSRAWATDASDEHIQRVKNDITFVKTGAMKMLARNTGAYMNEADPFDPDYEADFYGAHYQRLREIKREYDPHDVFYCRTCVGSSEWTQHDDGRLCRK